MAERIMDSEIIEQKQAIVDGWIRGMSERQEVGEMSQDLLREVLESYGANFENLDNEGRESLRGYSEQERGKGVRQVWGNEFVNSYKEWAKGYLTEYELKTGVEWPRLINKEHPEESSFRKASGINQFLFELTSSAAKEITPSNFKNYMETRIKNGVAWVEGRKKERISVGLPNTKEPKKLGSIPKEFPVAAMDWLKNN